MIYLTGRIFQIVGLIAMPSAMWVAQFEHNERGSIAIFVASIFVFYAGYFLTRLSRKG